MRMIALIFGLIAATMASAEAVIVQSTTSTKNSGLYDHIMPIIERDLGIKVSVVAVGTGQAIRNAWNCDGDVLLVHAKAAEEKFIAQGGGLERQDLMYNDFVIVGPTRDPAGIAGMRNVSAALQTIADTQSIFASRGDDSGTHKKELQLWQSAGVDPSSASGTWYRETGSGMGTTLNTGIGMSAYVMTDRATWLTFSNKQDFTVLVEGDPSMFNQYGVILVNAQRCPSVKADAGQALIDWLHSEAGRSAIASHVVDGQQLFFPNAKDD